MMKWILLVIVLGSALAVPAVAFEKVGVAETRKSAEMTAVPLGLSESKKPDKEAANGGLMFPGLGALGVLPKLDFGLELLYGEGQPQVVEPDDNDVDSEGLRIKGTLKHRF